MPDIKIGLEIHGYIDVEEKLFCNCTINHEADANTTICPVCTGQPGAKPMATNKHAINKAIAIALLLGCNVNKKLLFQRKHYSWPDMPTGFQRTMSGSYSVPVGEDGEFLGIGIEECHLEEDPARWDPETGKVDYNRAGYPLIEIVTRPDFTSAEQVGTWLKQLITALSYIKAVHKQAGIKSDVNVSISPKFDRVEIKNVNSISSIVASIQAEAQRQEVEIKSGKNIPPQTRTWSDEQGETLFMRSKESAQDYMFIPEPDIPVIHVDEKTIAMITSELPERPDVKRKKLIDLGISKEDATILSNEYVLIGLFEKVAKEVDPQLTARWLRREVVRVANYNKQDLDDLLIDEQHLIDLLSLLEKGDITENVAQKVLEKLMVEPLDVKAYVEREGLMTTSDAGELENICKQVIDEQPQAVDDYKEGNEKSLHFLVGQVMRKTKGTAKPDVVLATFKNLLD